MTKLFLITQYYPFENNEEPFIIPELRRLMREFDVTIIAADVVADVDIKSNIPLGVKVVRYEKNEVILFWEYYKIIGYKISKICRLAKKNREFNKRYYAKGKTFEKWFRKQRFVKKNEEFVIYSYWFMWWNLGFAEQKEKYRGMKLVTRTHGFDLYDERHREGKQPFRKYLDYKMDKIFFISEKGRDYYLAKQANLPVKPDKYIVSYLGQEDYFNDSINRRVDDNFTIVSCSNVIPLKRVELIAKALREIKSERTITWVHFGDGLSFGDLEKEVEATLVCKPTINIELRGRVKNQEVIDFYGTKMVDVFITTSSSEGLPVSISEAMCFGIPIIATDVGGISEQVDENGILISSNPTVAEIAEAIDKMLLSDSKALSEMGEESRKVWLSKFDIEKNAESFIGYIK